MAEQKQPATFKLSTFTLSLQGKATLAANRLARKVDAIYARRWAEFKKKPDAALFGASLEREVTATIAAGLVAVAGVSSAGTQKAILRAVPPAMLLAIHRKFDTLNRFLRREDASLYRESWLTAAQLTGGVPDPIKDEVASIVKPLAHHEAISLVHEPFHGRSWTSRLSNATLDVTAQHAIAQEIADGLVAGKSTQKIARAIAPLIDGKRANALRIARTETHRVNVTAQMRSLTQGLGDSIKAWVYVATLDSRTAIAHAALDGTRYERGAEKPYLPSRPNCRCVYSPEMASWEELGFPEEVSAQVDELTGGRASTVWNRATDSLEGEPVQAGTDYGAWFNAQPKEVKIDVLGQTLYDQLASAFGRVKWTKVLEAHAEGEDEEPPTTAHQGEGGVSNN